MCLYCYTLECQSMRINKFDRLSSVFVRSYHRRDFRRLHRRYFDWRNSIEMKL